MNGEKLAEGKTKIIWPGDMPGVVLIESKDDITAGDGARHDIMPRKGELSTQTTSNCFQLLRHVGLPTHFMGQVDERAFRAQEVTMMPYELVSRRRPAGSFVERHPEISQSTRFDAPIFEMFAKNDALHDPLVTFDYRQRVVRSYDPHQPTGPNSLLAETPLDQVQPPIPEHRLDRLRKLSTFAFRAIETAWAAEGVELVDMKIECGLNKRGRLVIADVIDNDSWRLRLHGDPEKMLDKQLYRQGRPMLEVEAAYWWVARTTDRFARLT
jgi:phosphoribosylaminoimidazole-succinocarboxamide synthase